MENKIISKLHWDRFKQYNRVTIPISPGPNKLLGHPGLYKMVHLKWPKNLTVQNQHPFFMLEAQLYQINKFSFQLPEFRLVIFSLLGFYNDFSPFSTIN